MLKTEKQICDGLWALLVKARANFNCEYTGKSGFIVNLQAHHIIGKKNLALRYCLENGISINNGVHSYVAHGSYEKQERFKDFLQTKRGVNIFYVLGKVGETKPQKLSYYRDFLVNQCRPYLPEIEQFVKDRDYKSKKTIEYYNILIEVIKNG